MIFRKPYAFLIKHFKIIHFLIAILSFYVAYKTYNIIVFFQNFITSNYTGSFYAGFYSYYISALLNILILLIIFGLAAIVLLFYYKKKPSKIYISSIIYFVIFLIFLSVIKNVMITLESTTLSSGTIRVYRDLSILSFIPQPLFIILFLLRGFGFNIHKFNFKEDLKELEISEEDNEEVEITFKKDGVKIQRNLRRFIREFQYYIVENKFIFILICIFLFFGVAFIVYKALPEIVDTNYRQGDLFNITGLQYRIEDSIITNLDYKGDIISNDYYYVVVKLNIENKTTEKIALDYNKFRLDVNNRYEYPVKDMGKRFIDYANEYYGKELDPGSQNYFSLVYKINKNEVKKNYKIKIESGFVLSNSLQIGKFNNISISPTIITQVSTEGKYKKNDEISLINSNLGDSTFKVSDVVITDKYIYDYEVCQDDKCNTYKNQVNIDFMQKDKTLVVLGYKFNLDNNIPYYKTSSNIAGFVNNFLKIKAIINNQEKYLTIKNNTPSNLKDKIVLETSNEINDADELYLAITIRNKEYLINLK